MDIDLIQARLTKLKSTNKKQTSLWKPEEGENIIRIVPYKFNAANPFIELYFHYEVAKKTFLSPITFGRPDPIEEFAQKLKDTGKKEDWQLARKLEPKMRTYVPVVVRGKESEGVKFWGFGKTVYQDLLSFIADPDYGDISDPMSGRDIVVDFQKATKAGEYPTTSIRVKPNVTPVTENPEIIKKIGDQLNITDEIFVESSYEDLKTALVNWLNPEEETETAPTSEATIGTIQKTTGLPPGIENVSESEKPTVVTADVSKAFDDLFKKS